MVLSPTPFITLSSVILHYFGIRSENNMFYFRKQNLNGINIEDKIRCLRHAGEWIETDLVQPCAMALYLVLVYIRRLYHVTHGPLPSNPGNVKKTGAKGEVKTQEKNLLPARNSKVPILPISRLCSHCSSYFL